MSGLIGTQFFALMAEMGVGKEKTREAVVRFDSANQQGQTYERIISETERDRYMSTPAAKEYGLIDEVLSEAPSKKKD